MMELFSILEGNDEVGCVSLRLSSRFLPVNTFPESKTWLPIPIQKSNYLVNRTGFHFALTKVEYIKEFINYIKIQNLTFTDTNYEKYLHDVYNRVWVSTIKTKCVHLTWRNYNDLNNSYTKYKLSKSLDEHWQKRQISDFKVYD